VERAWLALQGYLVRGGPLERWAVFLAFTAGLFLVLHIARGLARKRFTERAAKTAHAFDVYLARLLDRTWSLTLLAGAAIVALNVGALRSPGAGGRDDVEQLVSVLAILALFLQVGRWGTSLIDSALEQGFRFAKVSESTAQTAVGVVRFFGMAALWSSVAILMMSAVGVEVTPLLAGLGVGGIAVGFALQRILGDIFCSVAILLDRPFEVGDLIQAGEYMGTVERIGVKTTRVRSVGGEQIIFPNSDLIQSRVRNFKRMTERRVAFRFGVAHDTPAATVERIPALLREIFVSLDSARLDRAHFAAFGESTLNFEVVYYVLDPDPHLAMNIQQQINLALLRGFEGLGVRLVVPRPLRDIAETEKKD
jgi:small-conductance mechanosensitive channel